VTVICGPEPQNGRSSRQIVRANLVSLAMPAMTLRVPLAVAAAGYLVATTLVCVTIRPDLKA
jgi:hypothetical protein